MSNSAPVRRVRISPGTDSGLTHAAVLKYLLSQGLSQGFSIDLSVRHPTHFSVMFSREMEPELVLGNRVIENFNVEVTREPFGADNSPYSRETGSSRSTPNQSMRSVRKQAQRQIEPNIPYANQQNLIPQTNIPPMYPNYSAGHQIASSPMQNFQSSGTNPMLIPQPRLTRNPFYVNPNQGGWMMQDQLFQQRRQFDSRGAAQAQMSANPLMNPYYRVRGNQYMPMQQTRGNVFLNPAQFRPPQHQFIQTPSSQTISVQIRPPQAYLTQAPPPQIISAQVQPYRDQSSQPSQHPPPTHHQAIDDHRQIGASSTSLASGNAFLYTPNQTQTSQVQRTQGQPQLTEIQPTQPQSHQQVDDDSGSFKAHPVNVTRNKVHDESEASSKK